VRHVEGAGHRRADLALLEGDLRHDLGREHGDAPVGLVDRAAAARRLLVERRARRDSRGHVRDVDGEEEAVARLLPAERVVDLDRLRVVEGHGEVAGQVLALGVPHRRERVGEPFREAHADAPARRPGVQIAIDDASFLEPLEEIVGLGTAGLAGDPDGALRGTLGTTQGEPLHLGEDDLALVGPRDLPPGALLDPRDELRLQLASPPLVLPPDDLPIDRLAVVPDHPVGTRLEPGQPVIQRPDHREGALVGGLAAPRGDQVVEGERPFAIGERLPDQLEVGALLVVEPEAPQRATDLLGRAPGELLQEPPEHGGGRDLELAAALGDHA
jgi:hypothetical protein